MKLTNRSELSTFGLRVWSGQVYMPHPPHRHNEIELNVVESGYLTYLLAGHELTVANGELALFWGAIPHQVVRAAATTRVYLATIPLAHVLHWELPQSFVRAMLTGTLFRDHDPIYDRRFFAHWERDLAAGQQPLVLMEIKALFFRFAQTRQPDSVPAAISDRRTNQMALFMTRHFHEPLSVAAIAGQVGLHPNYAMRLFRDTFGLSLIEYLTQQRIAHAQQLLITSDAPIIEIAIESGFATLSHFYTAFNRLCGVAPGKYRASLRRG